MNIANKNALRQVLRVICRSTTSESSEVPSIMNGISQLLAEVNVCKTNDSITMDCEQMIVSGFNGIGLAPPLLASGCVVRGRTTLDALSFENWKMLQSAAAMTAYLQACTRERAYWMKCYDRPPSQASLALRRVRFTPFERLSDSDMSPWQELSIEELSILCPKFMGLGILLNHLGNDPLEDAPCVDGQQRRTLGLIIDVFQDPLDGSVRCVA
jgi:hypothetical protein